MYIVFAGLSMVSYNTKIQLLTPRFNLFKKVSNTKVLNIILVFETFLNKFNFVIV